MNMNEVSKHPLPNYEHVGGNIYIVRTQAGFRQARRHWGDCISGMEGNDGDSYPTSYPSLVTFSAEYRGYHYTHVHAVHLNKAFPIINKHQAIQMEENTIEQQKPYRVCANLDQLQKIGLDKQHPWTRQYPEKLPNSVVCWFATKEEAIEVYNTLWRQKLVAFRNWLD